MFVKLNFEANLLYDIVLSNSPQTFAILFFEI